MLDQTDVSPAIPVRVVSAPPIFEIVNSKKSKKLRSRRNEGSIAFLFLTLPPDRDENKTEIISSRTHSFLSSEGVYETLIGIEERARN